MVHPSVRRRLPLLDGLACRCGGSSLAGPDSVPTASLTRYGWPAASTGGCSVGSFTLLFILLARTLLAAETDE